ncbi:hypothetical protein GCM10023116_34240 [Kistimonas scapharcae]|uniref:Uncharacterized protein n=1 Tax=Kistimonas scapharcae TaxID=1036133 RepID=A0ABP8V753_9GAMM
MLIRLVQQDALRRDTQVFKGFYNVRYFLTVAVNDSPCAHSSTTPPDDMRFFAFYNSLDRQYPCRFPTITHKKAGTSPAKTSDPD